MDTLEPKPAADAPVPPPLAAEADMMETVRLEVRVEELERRLRARSIEFETELKAKERLRERVRELASRVDDLQETASALHREAASSTSLARELDETLKIAAEARLQLGAALEAERRRRIDIEAEMTSAEGSLAVRATALEGALARLTEERAVLVSRADAAEESSARVVADLVRIREEALGLAAKNEAQAAEGRKRDEELSVARRNLSQLRQKTVGHEAHIESLRADLEGTSAARAAYEAMTERAEKADSELLSTRARVEELSRSTTVAKDALEQSLLLMRRSEDESRRLQAVIDVLQKSFDERQAAEEAKMRQTFEAAEQIRREGVEAFEKAREAKIRQEMEGERVHKELSAGRSRLAAESEQLKAKAEMLKQELRARADRESAEMRLALDEERARLYADVEAERQARGRLAAPVPTDDPTQRDREAGEARRREIAKEVEGYLADSPRILSDLPAPAPSRWDSEIRLLLYVAISVSLVVAVVAGLVLYQG